MYIALPDAAETSIEKESKATLQEPETVCEKSIENDIALNV